MRRIIFDVDTGSDDALEVIYAYCSRKMDIKGITTIFGAYSIDETTKHTLQIVDMLNCNIPVYKGCSRSLTRHLYPQMLQTSENNKLIGDRKIGYHEVFSDSFPKHKCEETHAVTYLINELTDSKDKITIVTSGALTNIASVIRLRPELKKNIQEIVIMGGGINVANKTSASEGNFYRDPEAARIVLESGCNIFLIPLDATMKVPLCKEDADKIKNKGTKVAEFVSNVIETRIEAYNSLVNSEKKGNAYVHDLLCTFYLLDPSVISETVHYDATVSISFDEAAGKLLVDQREGRIKPNLNIAINVDKDKYMDLLFNSI